MKIGELARHTGCDTETIRYYEKAGLLAEPSRRDNGYRDYAKEHLERLQFIRHCRSLQLGLSEIRVLLDLKAAPMSGCATVDAMLDGHIAQVRKQIEELKSLERQLVELRGQCNEPHTMQECGIMQNLKELPEQHECACHGPAVAASQRRAAGLDQK